MCFKLIGKLCAALGHDTSVDENVDEVGADVTQDARVVSDQQNANLTTRSHAINALGHHLERVNVQAGVSFIEDGNLRL